jgi:hypothetical protein
MENINLTPGEEPKKKIIEEIESIKNLPVSAGQAILDKIFSGPHREKKLAEQEEDINGLKVRYFRKMSFEAFLQMAKTGHQDAAAYETGKQPEINEKELMRFIIDGLPLEFQERMELRKNANLKLKDVITENYGAETYNELEANNFSYPTVMNFVKKNMKQEYLKQRHTGSLMQKFSPFISMSVGGVITTLSSHKYPYKTVYCEIITKNIIPHETGVQGEKEVFTEKLEFNDVIGAYVDDESLLKSIKSDPTFSQGNYYQKNKDNKDILKYSDDIIEQWRWNVETKDCLPKRLIQ